MEGGGAVQFTNLKKDCLLYVLYLSRVWGLVTALGLWGVGVEVTFNGAIVGYYVLFLAALVSVLESLFLITIILSVAVKKESKRCISCWNAALWLDDWKKGFLYVLLTVYCFAHPFLNNKGWLAVIGGTLLLILGLLNFMKSARKKRAKLVIRAEADNSDPFSNRYQEEEEALGSALGSGSSLVNEIITDNDTTPLAASQRTVADQQEMIVA